MKHLIPLIPYYNQIPVSDIFLNDDINNIHGKWKLKRDIKKEADKYINDRTVKYSDAFKELPIEDVPIDKIIPTQKFLTSDNLSSARDSEDTGAYLLKYGAEYYVIDGHHRIANRILAGHKTIKAYVRT